MFEWLALALGVIVAGTAGLGGYIRWQGDEDIVLDTGQVKNTKITAAEGESVVRFEMPLVNNGKQNGMVIDLFCQPEYPGPVLERVEILPRCRVQKEDPRADWYWEAVIVEKKKAYTVEGKVIIRGIGSVQDLAVQIPSLKLSFYLKNVGRREIRYRMFELEMNIRDLAKEQLG